MSGGEFSRTFSTLIITRDAIYREGLARILPPERFQVILKTSSLNTYKLEKPRDDHPDLIILGTTCENLTHLDDIGSLHQRWPNARIVVLSDRHGYAEIGAAFEAGVSAWVEHPSSHDALLHIIDLVLSGDTILISSQLNRLLVGNAVAARSSGPVEPDQPHESLIPLDYAMSEASAALCMDSKPHMPSLSDREKMIAAMLVSGYPNKVIARSIAVSEATVKVHIKSILRKIRVTNRTQAAIWATKNGFVGPDDRASVSMEDARTPIA